MIKIKKNTYSNIFQTILNIDYIKCLKLWKGVPLGMHNFKWYKIGELSEKSRKKKSYLLCIVMTILSSKLPCHIHTRILQPLRSF